MKREPAIDQRLRKIGITKVYHFTDSANLPSIKKYGLLSLHQINQRKIEKVVFASSPESRSIDQHYDLDDYVRLAFIGEHPMEYTARQNKNIKKPVFLEIDSLILHKPGVKVADGIAYGRNSEIYDLVAGLDKLDLECLFSRLDWSDPSVKERRLAAKKYEILVPIEIPPKYIKFNG